MAPVQFGNYLLLEPLGSGGMAEVYLARTADLSGFQKLLAVKRLLPACSDDSNIVRMLADEARITVQLDHPNIVQIFDFGRVGNSYYLAMEYIDGLDLKGLVETDGQASAGLPLDLALHIGMSVLSGLDFAHKRKGEDGEPLGIIHRDVTPQNVLVSRHGLVKLTDFGVARARISSHFSYVGDVRGKFSYMPPEQACGGELDHRVDIFATGAILYQMITGQQPFRSSGSTEQMVLLNRSVQPPSQLVDDLPPAIDEIVLEALHVDPEKRFVDASTFNAALRQQFETHCRTSNAATVKKLAGMVQRRLARQRHVALDSPDSGTMRRRDFALSGEHSLIGWRPGASLSAHEVDPAPDQPPEGAAPQAKDSDDAPQAKPVRRTAETEQIDLPHSLSGELLSAPRPPQRLRKRALSAKLTSILRLRAALGGAPPSAESPTEMESADPLPPLESPQTPSRRRLLWRVAVSVGLALVAAIAVVWLL